MPFLPLLNVQLSTYLSDFFRLHILYLNIVPQRGKGKKGKGREAAQVQRVQRVVVAPFGRIIKEAPEAPYLANAVVLYNSLGRQALNPSGRHQPVPDRTLGAQGRRPGGPKSPRGEAASTFGNTAERRFCPPCQKEQTPECLPFSSKESINFYQAKGTHLPSLTWRTSRSILGSLCSSNWNLPVAPSKSLICARASRNFFLSVVLPDFSAASCIT